jgi:hypothetical protein
MQEFLLIGIKKVGNIKKARQILPSFFIPYAHGVPPSTIARSSHRNQLPVFARN